MSRRVSYSCGCPDGAHEAMKASDSAWYALKFFKIWRCEGYGPDLEMRHCPGGSTLGRALPCNAKEAA